ncbi:CCRG-2 family RiPP [Prochlorococcus sp. MIT 1201]|uniref:CCRG-2 family RiPP n=1 Tax=Prochlorococcus sp. MIT 1201 TaxID=3082535 RepID=UPI0039A4F264
MTGPKENEEINEELSIDELKSVSGGLRGQGSSGDTVKGGSSEDFLAGQGSGSGMTLKDWKKATR